MQGRVYSILRTGQHDDLPHPNAIILFIPPDSYLCVAGFTPGKEKYEQAKKAEFTQGVWGPAFGVEIDHKKHLTPVDPKLDLHDCGYVCQTAILLTAAQARAGKDWGELSSVAVREIGLALLEREKVRPFLAKKVVAALKKFLGV